MYTALSSSSGGEPRHLSPGDATASLVTWARSPLLWATLTESWHNGAATPRRRHGRRPRRRVRYPDQRRAHTRSERPRRAARDGRVGAAAALAFLGSGFFDSKDAFPEEALDKLIGLAGDGDRASVLRAALKCRGRRRARGRGATSSFTKGAARGRGAGARRGTAAHEPAGPPPRRAPARHGERPRDCKTGARGAARAAAGATRGCAADQGRGRVAAARRGAAGEAAAARAIARPRTPPSAAAAPNTVACPICGVRVAVADPRRPDAEMDAHLERCGRRRPRRAASNEEESDQSYSDASEDARRALELRAAASSSEEDEDSSSDDDGPLRLRSTEAIADDGTDDALRARLENIEESDDDDDDALRLPGGFVLRASISSRLYAHQRRAVGWLWDSGGRARAASSATRWASARRPRWRRFSVRWRTSRSAALV